MPSRSTYQIGQTILSLLKERSLTQQFLADSLGISKQVMHKIINGKKVMNVAELARIAQALGVSTDLLLVNLVSPPRVIEPLFIFRGAAMNDEARGKLDILRTIIDEIKLLEGLLDE